MQNINLHPAIAQIQAPQATNMFYQQLLNNSLAAQTHLYQGAQPSLLQSATAAAVVAASQHQQQGHQQQQHHYQQQHQQSQQPETMSNVNLSQTLLAAQNLNMNMNQILHPNLFQQLQTFAQLLNPLAYCQQMASLVQQQQQLQQLQQQQQLHQQQNLLQQNLSKTLSAQQSSFPTQNGVNISASSVPTLQQQNVIDNILSNQLGLNASTVKYSSRGMTPHAERNCSQRNFNLRNVAEMDSDEIGEHISDLISKHTAILEENPSQIRRRAYHRQTGRHLSMEIQTDHQTQEESTNIFTARTIANRSHSLFDSCAAFTSNALTEPPVNGQRILRVTDKVYTCNYCQITFANETGLEAHEIRCIKRNEGSHSQNLKRKSSSISTPSIDSVADSNSISIPSSSTTVLETQHPLKKRLLAAAEQHHLESLSLTSGKISKISPYEVVKPVNNGDHATIRIATSGPFSQMAKNSVAVRCSSSINNLFSNRFAYPESSSAQTQADGINDTTKPYILTLSDSSNTAQKETILQPRWRARSHTMETNTCRRAAMTYCEVKDKFSAYNNYQHKNENETIKRDHDRDHMYLKCYSSKPLMGLKENWRFTTAMREMRVLRVTHSSYWELSSKLRMSNYDAKRAAIASEVLSISEQSLHTVATENSLIQKSVCSEAVCALSSSEATTTNVYCITPVSTPKKVDDDMNSDTEEQKPSSLVECQNSPEYTGRIEAASTAKLDSIFGDSRSDEVDVYVRGRGRGRYVCDRCGIRCKKPSMLKKHIRSHTDIRPYSCKSCNFSFKTKGNLTKHLQSKTHRNRLREKQVRVAAEQDCDSDQDRLEIASQAGSSNALFDDDCTSEDDMQISSHKFNNISIRYHNFGQENILFERSSRTPPSIWLLDKRITGWPESGYTRLCHSAPPAAYISSEARDDNTQEIIDDNDLSEKSNTCQSDSQMSVSSPERTETSAISQSSLETFMAKQENTCDICDRVFRKATELALHRHTHSFEVQTAKTRTYVCAECKTTFRSRSQLNKHLEMNHQNAKPPQIESNDSEIGNNDPRAFRCNDCNIGFRKHGVLAKHLRSKGHVAKLESQGKVADDALALIYSESNLPYLNHIDTTDCESARRSLIAILAVIRDSSSLECREQLSQSPAPCASHSNISPKKRASTTFSGQELKKSNDTATSERQSESRSRIHRLNSVSDESTSRSILADVWIPPKDEALIRPRDGTLNGHRPLVTPLVYKATKTDSPVLLSFKPVVMDSSAFSDNGSSVRSDEAVSDGACRSESSTPINRAANSSTFAVSASTKCAVCDTNFESITDLQIHMHADHIEIRDGSSFQCPTRGCNKVYPNRENLRLHIAAHFCFSRIIDRCDERETHEERDAVVNLQSGIISTSNRKLTGVMPLGPVLAPVSSHLVQILPLSSHCTRAKLSSPSASDGTETDDVPPMMPSLKSELEESRSDQRTVNSLQVQNDRSAKEEQNSVTNRESPCTITTALPCAICGSCFPNAFILQQHWLSHVCDRPHICKLCDAGFTTAEALDSHAVTHQNVHVRFPNFWHTF